MKLVGDLTLITRVTAAAFAAEPKLDPALANNNFDLASAALLAIVLASASVVLGVAFLAWGAGGLGIVAVVLAAFGWFAPTLLPL